MAAALTTPSPVRCGLIVGVAAARPRGPHDRVDQLVAVLVERTGLDGEVVADLSEAEDELALRSGILCVDASGRSTPPISRLSAPCLVVGPRFDPARLRTAGGDVLVALDGSPRSEQALPAALHWATLLDTGVCLATVTSMRPPSPPGEHPHDRLEAAYVARAARRAERGAVRPSWDVLHGDPGTALLAYGERTGATMLAVNSHGTHTAVRAQLGKVPASLIRHGPLPVLLTRSRVAPRPSLPTAPSRPRSRRAAAPPIARPPRVPTAPAASRSPARPVGPQGRRARLAAAAAVTIAGVALAFVPLPYQTLGGSTLPARDMLQVEGVPGGGRTDAVLVPFLRPRRVSALEILRSRLGSGGDIRPAPDRRTERLSRDRGELMMDEATRQATAVAAGHLGIDQASVGVRLDAHGVGGPSAGLAFALEIVDQLSPGDLTDGRPVAVTGALEADGRVTPVVGIGHKARAAERAGAELLLVPAANHAEAVQAVDDLEVRPVGSFGDALAALAAFAAS